MSGEHAPRHDHEGHEHPHAATSRSTTTRAFAYGTLINLGYTAIEAGYGFATHSLALLSDALHNFGDVLGLALAWGAVWLAQRRPTDTHTYGWRRATQLAPLVNSLILVAFCGALLSEAARRLLDPPAIPALPVIVVAAIGIVVNLGSAWFLRDNPHDHRGAPGVPHGHDLNRHGAYLHLLADAAVSLAAVMAGLGMYWLGWRWLDPAMALLVSLVIAATSWGLLRESFRQNMDAVPGHLNLAEVQATLEAMTGVVAVHHLHVWSLGGHEVALTAHVLRSTPDGHDAFIDSAGEALNARFGINHTTLQIEFGPGCVHDCDDPAPHH